MTGKRIIQIIGGVIAFFIAVSLVSLLAILKHSEDGQSVIAKPESVRKPVSEPEKKIEMESLAADQPTDKPPKQTAEPEKRNSRISEKGTEATAAAVAERGADSKKPETSTAAEPPVAPEPKIRLENLPTNVRNWTDSQDRKILAKVTRFDEAKQVIDLKRADGKEFSDFPVSNLSGDDRKFLMEFLTSDLAAEAEAAKVKVLARAKAEADARRANRPPGLREISEQCVGATDKDVYEKLVSYAASGDEAAFNRFLAAGMLTGICRVFEKGEEVHVEKVGFFKHLVRPKGKLLEYWVAAEFID